MNRFTYIRPLQRAYLYIPSNSNRTFVMGDCFTAWPWPLIELTLWPHVIRFALKAPGCKPCWSTKVNKKFWDRNKGLSRVCRPHNKSQRGPMLLLVQCCFWTLQILLVWTKTVETHLKILFCVSQNSYTGFEQHDVQ